MEKNAYSLIIEPILTEKTNILRTEPHNTEKRYYVFKVHKDANKPEIIKSIKELYDVNPLGCRIINVKPRKKNRRMSRRGYTRSYKKAIIILDGKEKIEIIK